MQKTIVYNAPLIPTLFAHHLSSPSWKVRMALEHKRIPHKIRVIDWTKNETVTMRQRSPPFLNTINPAGQIPVLDIGGGRFIRESPYNLSPQLAILEYLEEAYPDEPLLPNDSYGRAKIREVCHLIGSGIHPLQTSKLAALHSPDKQEQLRWTQMHLTEGFKALEKFLLKSTGEFKGFCFQDSITMADCVFVPQVYNAVEKNKMDLTKSSPTIWQIYQNLQSHPIVKSTHPRNGKLS